MSWNRCVTTRSAATRGTSGTPRHTRLTRYRCSLPGLAGFAGNRCTEPEVPPIGSPSAKISAHKTASRSLAQRHSARKASALCVVIHSPLTRLELSGAAELPSYLPIAAPRDGEIPSVEFGLSRGREQRFRPNRELRRRGSEPNEGTSEASKLLHPVERAALPDEP